MEFDLTTIRVLDAPAAVVFDAITDIDRLPRWNREVAEVHERPAVLDVGADWVVEMRAMGTHWASRSTAVAVDREAGRFAYRSRTDDDNPSYADWEWRVVPDGDGTSVRVSMAARPRTFWRRYLLSTVRRRSLRKAMERSLDALGDHLATTHVNGKSQEERP